MPMTALDQWMTLTETKDRTLAEKVGISRPYVTRIRSGERRPSLPVAIKLAEATKLPVSAFLTSAA